VTFLRISVDERIQGTNLFFREYLEGYRQRVHKYYSDAFNKRSDSFPLMKPTLMFAVHLNKTTFFLFIESDQDHVENIVATDEQNQEYNEMMSVPDHIREEYINQICSVAGNKVIKRKSLNDLAGLSSNAFARKHHGVIPGAGFKWGEKEADWDYRGYQLEIAIVKTVKSSADFPLFDIDAITARVNDDQFRYEFEESIKAYNAGLYLASSITAAVSVETLMKLLFIKHIGKSRLPQKYFITNLVEELKAKEIVDEKMYHRILSINQLRRGVAHSKTGKVEQWDAEQIIGSIKIIVETLF
jgi:HEPN domain-containing protein